MSLRFREATPEDAEAIAALHIHSWQHAYHGLLPEDYLNGLPSSLPNWTARRRERLEHPRPQERTWVAESGSEMIGVAITGSSRDEDAAEDTAEVFAIYLEPQVIGTGIGRALFTHAVDDLRQRGFRQATLWVLAANARARRFYAAAGWKPDGASKIEERPGLTLDEVRYRTALIDPARPVP